jgi:hypothetical protein
MPSGDSCGATQTNRIQTDQSRKVAGTSAWKRSVSSQVTDNFGVSRRGSAKNRRKAQRGIPYPEAALTAEDIGVVWRSQRSAKVWRIGTSDSIGGLRNAENRDDSHFPPLSTQPVAVAPAVWHQTAGNLTVTVTIVRRTISWTDLRGLFEQMRSRTVKTKTETELCKTT